ncbi:EAL domain-containing protein [Cohnella sp. CFH 77786]|uniref:putative bifunctional diguanylate cyclase/phosphodiesterase n=1 Tax=Cohnella sp. CFH 77786 TaxID=2662265 RepID=UPI001C60F206|nr:EAL domain-containing protein [Cohnella sp. CFH 77786]MBW5449306.1 EAL domain-containing protein [Cohnella sp. CFH 77786]
MKVLLLLVFFYTPFLILIAGAAEIYRRNTGSALYRYSAAMLLTNAVFFLGDILVQTLPIEYAPDMHLYVKTGSGLLNMTAGIYFIQKMTRSSVRPVWFHIGALLQIAGIGALAFGRPWFYVEVHQGAVWRTVERSEALVLLLLVSVAYSFVLFFFHLGSASRRLKITPWLSQERARVFLFINTTIALMLWVALWQLYGARAFWQNDYLQIDLITSYGNLFFCGAIRYAMVHYDFLSAPEKRYKLLFRETEDGIVIFDEAWRFVDANPAFLRMIGIEDKNDGSWQGASYTEFVHLEGSLPQGGQIQRARTGSVPLHMDLRFVNRQNRSYDIDAQVHFFETEGQIGSFVIVKDITSRKEYEQKLTLLAYHDPLTRLANRRQFYEKLTQMLGRPGYHAVLLIDLDQFKWINDTLGHFAGDELLLKAAERLQKAVPKYGCVARLGGDEFGVLLPDIQTEYEADALSLDLINKLRHPYDLMDQSLQVTASIGISIAPRDGTDAETLIRNADTAMYRSKREGRDQYRKYRPEQRETAQKALVLVNGLRSALEEQEFTLHYQPQVDVRTGRIVGAEALLRWFSPHLGAVSPADFIPVAEETGAIVPIGEWVLRAAVKQGKRWMEAGHADLKLSVNLSARQFRDPDLVGRLKEILSAYDFPAGNLCLEITESAAIEQLDQALAVIHEMKRLGVSLAIDDFGTGYSSLAMLNRLPFRTVKLDKSLIRDIGKDRKDAAVVRMIMNLSRRLEMEVLAEGVETEEQLRLLKRFRCHQVQGYLFGAPMPAEALNEWLAARQAFAAADQTSAKGDHTA